MMLSEQSLFCECVVEWDPTTHIVHKVQTCPTCWGLTDGERSDTLRYQERPRGESVKMNKSQIELMLPLMEERGDGRSWPT